MTDNLDDDMNEPKIPEEVKPEASTEAPKLPVKSDIGAVEKVRMIAPQSIDEAWRLSKAFIQADMVPDSLKGKTSEETQAKVMSVMLKGMEVGFGPATSLQTIMVINHKPCIYGDGTVSLLQKSGVVEYIKTETSGEWGEKGDYKVTITLKRKDQTEPYMRSFGYQDAKRAGLLGKKGPWIQYPERQCYWRALSWAARDGAGDALMGLGIAEEIQDHLIEQRREHHTDTTSLDD